MIDFICIDTCEVRRLQNGGMDANGQPPERILSNGEGNPCRHCFEYIKKGDEMLILAYKPFNTVQPYAEQGPIFLHAKECDQYNGSNTQSLPPTLKSNSHYILRGYDENERIVYGTGYITPFEEIPSKAKDLFGDNRVKFIHIRSATNNCYHARIDRN